MENNIENLKMYNDFKIRFEEFENLIVFLDQINQQSLINEEQRNAFNAMKIQLAELSTIPDLFNQNFSNLGWIAYESMKFDLMKKAVELAKKNQFDEAELELVNYYKSDEISFLINRLSGIEEFRLREEFLNLAYEDFKSERFYSCVLILLTIIDGVVDDISNKAFFVKDNEISIDNSIAGHKTGLEYISKLYSSYEKKTTNEKITIPYRNGIMHGKTFGYNNEFVASKCWALIFAIGDWSKSYKKQKENKKILEQTEIPIYEKLRILNESFDHLEKLKLKNQLISKKIEKWKPRNLVINQDIPETGKSVDYSDDTPEKELAAFFENWSKRNYGNIADQLWEYHKIPEPKNYKAGKLNSIFKHLKFIGFKIRKIEDSTSITEIETEIKIESKSIIYNKSHKFRLLYLDSEENNLFREEPNGKWKFVNNFNHLAD